MLRGLSPNRPTLCRDKAGCRRRCGTEGLIPATLRTLLVAASRLRLPAERRARQRPHERRVAEPLGLRALRAGEGAPAADSPGDAGQDRAGTEQQEDKGGPGALPFMESSRVRPQALPASDAIDAPLSPI
jgi:hypothetical protein